MAFIASSAIASMASSPVVTCKGGSTTSAWWEIESLLRRSVGGG
jgi:hypothetical protein